MNKTCPDCSTILEFKDDGWYCQRCGDLWDLDTTYRKGNTNEDKHKNNK